MEKPTPLQNKKLPLKQKVEAILFSVGARISIADIAKLARSREDAIKEVLLVLKQEYGQKDSSLVLIEDGDFWKLAVRDHYLSVVKKIVTETELSKTVLETLAVIAFKYPIRQSDLIKIRTNKAYDHLRELEGQGFISRKKQGRTNLIKLTEKFFQYFDLPEEKLKEHLSDFESIAAAIVRKEAELKERKDQQSVELSQMRSQEDRIKQEIEGLDSKKESAQITPQKIGQLEVFEEQKEKEDERLEKLEVYEEQKSPPSKEENSESQAFPSPPPPLEKREKEEEKAPFAESSGISTTPQMQAEIDRKVDEMLSPKKEGEEGQKDGASPQQADDLAEALKELRKRKKEGREQ